ncbi:DUF4209 domain-containing protein [Achromobacter xylosoxidans]
MTQLRYPADLPVTVEDFHACGWKEALQAIAPDDFGYSALWTALSKAARSAMESDRQTHAKVLWLLADASSMMLRPSSLTDPFKPFAVFHDRRSALPEDFSEDDLSFFAELIEHIDHPLLKARLADLLWLVGKPRNVQHALAAIDSYRSIPLIPDIWIRDGQECWERAFALALTLGKGSGDRIEDMLATMLDRLLSTNIREQFFGVKLARLLRNNRFAKRRGTEVAEKLEALALAFEQAGDIFAARACVEESALWFHWLGQQPKHVAMTVTQAETYVREATFHTAGAAPSNMVANGLYEKAIQIYRDVPRKMRAVHRVEERITELRALQAQTGEQTLTEMGVIRSPGIDITELVEQARRASAGREPIEALRSLANIHPGEQVDSLRHNVIERMRQFPLQWIFASTTYSRDGRVIAKRPAMNMLGAELSESDERTIQASMIRDYGMFIGITVQSAILPALESLRQEHRLRGDDFVELSRHSPIVPNGRAILFGKALFAGYDGDFVTALHLLVPQIEHMVRTHLKQTGALTTTLDAEGIETENGLSTLMALPETEDVFGKDLVFELKALFCDPFGHNLRNELAHGLLDDGDCRSAASIYAWWLGLKLVFNTWWNTRAANAQDGEKVDKEGEGESHA